jgi:thiamine-phosphate diphosphorylase
MNKSNFDYSLYLITDGKPDLMRRVEEALKGGVTCVQYREKSKTIDEMIDEATKLKALCHKYHVPLFINDYVEVAQKVGADGIHLGQSDESVQVARDVLGDISIGVSACTTGEAVIAQAQGAVYVGVGAMFSTISKDDATLVSMEEAMRIKESIDIPCLLIGGINLDTVEKIKTPYDGLCVISAILSVGNPFEAARKLKECTF